ncbi:MAG: hypothetical protein RIC38_08800, partial [Chromatocurvus sp.]
MKAISVYLGVFAVSLASAAGSAEIDSTGALPGEWACYGFEEQATTIYSSEFDMAYTEDGEWRSQGRFGEVNTEIPGQSFEWDYSATGTWSVQDDMLLAKTGTMRFLPTRGGSDYEAANPKEYLRIPVRGDWRLELQEPEFMTLERKDGGLL